MATLEDEIVDNIIAWYDPWYNDLWSDEVFADISVATSLALANGYQDVAADSLTLGETLALIPGAQVVERTILLEQYSLAGVVGVILAEAARLSDRLWPGFAATIDDAVDVLDTPRLAAATRVLDSLGISSAVAARAQYGLRWADMLRMSDVLLRFADGTISETVSFTPVFSGVQRARRALGDDIAVSDAITPRFLLSAVAADTVELSIEQVLNMLYRAHLREGVEISALYLSPGGGVTAWAMNTRTAAVTEYDNFDFNSFARVGNTYVGATSEGLYELQGDTDDGDAILARIRSGFMQFGSVQLSRLKAAYLGMRGAGEYVLRIETGDGSIYDYGVSARDMRTTKVHMGKGQQARYFAFELLGSGADFDLDSIEFVPLVKQRRV